MEQGLLNLTLLGIDPALRITGYGVVRVEGRQFKVLEAGVIASNKKHDLAHRILDIYNTIVEVIRDTGPGTVIIEDLYADYRFPRQAVIMGHVRGACLLAAASMGIPVVTYTPAMVKKAVAGTGRASKRRVQSIVENLLGLEGGTRYDHVSDALALCLCHAFRAGV